MKRTVLFSSAGRRVALIECFRADAARLGLALRVLACDLKPHLSAACRSADGSYAVPRCSGLDYVPALLQICREQQVDLLVPTIDTELPALAAAQREFETVGTRVVVSSSEVVSVARNKARTAQVFAAAGVCVPRTASPAQVLAAPENWRWPVVMKPVGGSSSVGLQVARSVEDVMRWGATRDDYLVQEQWFGREYTVNLFCDGEGRVRCAIPHWRIETRGGEVSKGRTERVPALEEAARKIAAALPGARGPLCFQAIVDDERRAGVFEINARFGGGYPLAHHAGARFSQWLLEEACGLPSTAGDDWVEGITMLRYEAGVFLSAES